MLYYFMRLLKKFAPDASFSRVLHDEQLPPSFQTETRFNYSPEKCRWTGSEKLLLEASFNILVSQFGFVNIFLNFSRNFLPFFWIYSP